MALEQWKFVCHDLEKYVWKMILIATISQAHRPGTAVAHHHKHHKQQIIIS